jgi:hypothetical protein
VQSPRTPRLIFTIFVSRRRGKYRARYICLRHCSVDDRCSQNRRRVTACDGPWREVRKPNGPCRSLEASNQWSRREYDYAVMFTAVHSVETSPSNWTQCRSKERPNILRLPSLRPLIFEARGSDDLVSGDSLSSIDHDTVITRDFRSSLFAGETMLRRRRPRI